jgi:hypothetical protein
VNSTPTPFELVIWTAQECADHLREEKSTFLKQTQFASGFPARCQKPGQPRWPAMEVCKWALGSRQDHGMDKQAIESKAA